MKEKSMIEKATAPFDRAESGYDEKTFENMKKMISQRRKPIKDSSKLDEIIRRRYEEESKLK